MAENVLAMTLRMRNTAVTTSRNLRQEVDKTTVSAKRLGTQFGKSIKATRTSLGGLMGSMISLKSIIIATFAYRAIQRFSRFLGSLTDMYKDQIIQTTKLGQAMASVGNYTREGLASLHSYAEELQELTGIDNEQIEAQMSTLASYGKTAQEIRDTILTVLELSIAKHIELQASATLVGKAFVGETGTLSRYGIIIEKNLPLSEKFAAVMEKLAMHTGMAARLGETYAGQIDILGAAYRDWKKGLGEIIAKGVEFSGVLTSMNDLIVDQIAWMERWKPLLVSISQVGIEGFTGAMKSMHESIALYGGDILAWFVTFGNTVTIIGRTISVPFKVAITGLRVLSTALERYMMHMQRIGALIRLNFDEAAGWTEQLKATSDELGDSFVKFEEQIFSIQKSYIEGMNKDFRDIANIWEQSIAGQDKWTQGFRDAQAEMAKIRQAQDEQFINQQQINQEQEKTIELTKSMARQFALATRLEQEQTKFMLERLGTMEAEDLTGLTQAERKLIGKQGILKEAFGRLFGEYAQESLGIEASFLKAEQKVNVEIGLTDEAKELITATKTGNQRVTDGNFERLAG